MLLAWLSALQACGRVDEPRAVGARANHLYPAWAGTIGIGIRRLRSDKEVCLDREGCYSIPPRRFPRSAE